jgi:hypothetical protein
VTDILAEVRALSGSEIRSEIRQADGRCRLESPEAEVIIATLEQELGQELVKSEDLRSEHLTDLDVFVGLLWRRVQRRRAGGASNGSE